MLSLTRHLDTFPHAAMVQTFTKRPTSPLYYEPLYTAPEDVLYPGSDEEATPDEREKKGLRVEIQGQQYLNGRPLFIQSAGLRGPFEKGWVNPWRSKKRKYEIDDIRRFPAAEPEVFPPSLVEAGPTTAKRGFVKTSGYRSLDYDSENGAPVGIEASRQAAAKRTRHKELDEPHGYHGSSRKIDQGVDAAGRTSYHWLKTDRSYPPAVARDDVRSSTPTPAAKPRSKSHATSSRPREDSRRAVTLPPKSSHQKRLTQSKEDTLSNGSTNKITTLAASEKAHGETVKPNLPPGTIEPANDPPSHVREISLSTVDNVTRYGYEEVKSLSKQAVRQAENEDGQRQAKKLSEAAVARAIESDEKKNPSRLTPYVSEVVGSDAASSAALRAAKVPKPKPKPSPHAVPPSTYQPEFEYRYARKEMSTATSAQSAPFVDAPEQPQARLRSRSDSSSSSGSSAFAKALEAAQEKAALKSFASSKSTSPAIEGPETKSVKKNRQALRRLTFTPSGGAKIASALTSSRPSSSSSAIERDKYEMKHQDKPLSNDPPFLQRTSTKSSARSLTNGNRSRNSIIFPEAQTDPIARPPLAQAPSGPSTNLLETDKQSPKVPSFDEGDSYLDLSTQAAVWKAQRSFQADVVSALTPRLPKKEDLSPMGLTSGKAEITPIAHGHREIKLANAQLMKPSGSDDEEPMSTQAMIDAISPFAVTTIKKRPPAIPQRIDVVPSTTKKRKLKSPPQAPIFSPKSPSTVAFRTHSPGMSTSPSPSPSPSPEKSPPPIPLSHPTTNSKPRSSLTSFSILPNGTLTETSVYQQDGQQQEDFPDYDISLPADPFGFADVGGDGQRRDDDALDLKAAIDEAGSFLGDWDVEAEARKEGSLSRKRESGGRCILKGSA